MLVLCIYEFLPDQPELFNCGTQRTVFEVLGSPIRQCGQMPGCRIFPDAMRAFPESRHDTAAKP